MKYHICVRPYESGAVSDSKNNPKTWKFDLENDFEALVVACSMRYSTGKISRDKKEMYSKYSEEDLESHLEDYNLRDPFVFYIENVDEGYFVYDSGEDPEEWEEEDNDEDNDW